MELEFPGCEICYNPFDDKHRKPYYICPNDHISCLNCWNRVLDGLNIDLDSDPSGYGRCPFGCGSNVYDDNEKCKEISPMIVRHLIQTQTYYNAYQKIKEENEELKAGIVKDNEVAGGFEQLRKMTREWSQNVMMENQRLRQKEILTEEKSNKIENELKIVDDYLKDIEDRRKTLLENNPDSYIQRSKKLWEERHQKLKEEEKNVLLIQEEVSKQKKIISEEKINALKMIDEAKQENINNGLQKIKLEKRNIQVIEREQFVNRQMTKLSKIRNELQNKMYDFKKRNEYFESTQENLYQYVQFLQQRIKNLENEKLNFKDSKLSIEDELNIEKYFKTSEMLKQNASASQSTINQNMVCDVSELNQGNEQQQQQQAIVRRPMLALIPSLTPESILNRVYRADRVINNSQTPTQNNVATNTPPVSTNYNSNRNANRVYSQTDPIIYLSNRRLQRQISFNEENDSEELEETFV